MLKRTLILLTFLTFAFFIAGAYHNSAAQAQPANNYEAGISEEGIVKKVTPEEVKAKIQTKLLYLIRTAKELSLLVSLFIMMLGTLIMIVGCAFKVELVRKIGVGTITGAIAGLVMFKWVIPIAAGYFL